MNGKAAFSLLALAAVLGSGCGGPAVPSSQAGPVEQSPRPPGAAARGVWAATQPVGEPAAAFPAKPTLADCLAWAALNNPRLKAAFDRWRAAAEQASQAGALPDPRFTYRYFIREVETRVGPQRQSFGLAQTFPWIGTLGLRSDAAAQAAQAELARVQALKLELFYRVKQAYGEYYYLRRALAVVGENVRLLAQIESVARTRYQAAAVGHPDVIRAQVEQGKLADRLRALADLRGPIVADLNAAMNRPLDAALPWPEALEDPQVSPADAALLRRLAASNPQLKALDHRIAHDRRRIELARKAYFPDVTVGVDYIDTAGATGPRGPGDNGKDPVVAMVSVNLPIWWGKLSAGVREARRRHLVAVHERAEAANALGARLKLAAYRFRDAARRVRLYRDTLLPKASQSLKAASAAFRTGKASLTDLIDAERVRLEFQLARERALADKVQRLAELEMLVGGELAGAGSGEARPGAPAEARKGKPEESKP